MDMTQLGAKTASEKRLAARAMRIARTHLDDLTVPHADRSVTFDATVEELERQAGAQEERHRQAALLHGLAADFYTRSERCGHLAEPTAEVVWKLAAQALSTRAGELEELS